ncbi:hypothetical protein FAA86_02875 [Rhizobium rosettiformans W3]|uniref:Uncharacterized protein n=1 Tax=Rhizobium rosettiformans W3 TaxID=538378 RepID=A0A4S8Q975_9HYPH|nr:hypothetical protein FAA86_02875 [Rhizobium rosettiformans W3]
MQLTLAASFRPTDSHCLLPTAYCLLPTAYCLLPTAYCRSGLAQHIRCLDGGRGAVFDAELGVDLLEMLVHRAGG